MERLAAAIETRLPERSLLGIVGRTAHWLGWHHRFGPASGSDPSSRTRWAATRQRSSPAASTSVPPRSTATWGANQDRGRRSR
ncbi:hypothetical protein HFP72_00155 [Nocardiopsis sp. ARC36]